MQEPPNRPLSVPSAAGGPINGPNATGDGGATLPRYCCAILIAPSGELVMERRPSDDRDAPGRLTCFGGTRERDESPMACLDRELSEELGYALPAGEPARRVLVLTTPKGEAWFYVAPGPARGQVRALERGHSVEWIARAEILSAQLADWHRAALQAWLAGRDTASV